MGIVVSPDTKKDIIQMKNFASHVIGHTIQTEMD